MSSPFFWISVARISELNAAAINGKLDNMTLYMYIGYCMYVNITGGYWTCVMCYTYKLT